MNLETVVTMLNTLLDRDREGVSRFFANSEPVSMDLVDTRFEFMQSMSYPDTAELQPLGLLNGIVSEYEDGQLKRRVAIEYGRGCTINRFVIMDVSDAAEFEYATRRDDTD